MAISKIPVVPGTKTLARGSVVIGNASGEPSALAIGSNTYVLKSDGTDISWGADAGGTTINNNADNRIITGSGTANTLEGESTLTYDGTNLDLADSKKIRLGTGNDFEIYHDGSNSIIHDGGEGDLLIRAEDDLRLQDTSGYDYIHCNTDSSVELYHNKVKKLETTANGVLIQKASSGATALADANALVIESDADTGLSILQHTGGNGTIAFGDSGDNNIGMIQYYHGSVNAMVFFTNASEALRLTDSGYLVSPPTYGLTSGQSANVYINSSGTFKRSTSALKYKTDVRDLESIDISSFRPIRYKSNVADDDPNEEFMGFIADEFHDAGLTELVSYSVSYAENDTKKENPIYEVEGFNYDRLTAILTKSLQNSQTKITALETSVADLTTRLEALESA